MWKNCTGLLLRQVISSHRAPEKLRILSFESLMHVTSPYLSSLARVFSDKRALISLAMIISGGSKTRQMGIRREKVGAGRFFIKITWSLIACLTQIT